MAVSQRVALDMDFQQNRAFLLFSPVGPRCSSQGLAVAAALGESKPEPQSLGTTFKDGLPLGDKGGRAQRQGWSCWQSSGHLLPAEGGAASRWTLLRPFAPPRGALEAGFEVLSLSGDLEPLDHTPRPERQQLPPAGAQGCPRVMLPVAPRNAGPN